jgi:hypothetical protein
MGTARTHHKESAMAKARSISAASLSKLTQAAVKAATPGIRGRYIGIGPTMGFIPQRDLGTARDLALARKIASGVAANARAVGIAGLRPQPVVVIRPGRTIAGFIGPELGIQIRK